MHRTTAMMSSGTRNCRGSDLLDSPRSLAIGNQPQVVQGPPRAIQPTVRFPSMTLIEAAGGKPQFWAGLIVAAAFGALAWLLSLVAVPALIHAFGG